MRYHVIVRATGTVEWEGFIEADSDSEAEEKALEESALGGVHWECIEVEPGTETVTARPNTF